MSFRIKFKPYEAAKEIVVGITILPSIEIKVNYQVETRYEDDPDSYAYGLISSGTTEYELVKNKRGCDFSIERNGVLADVTKNDYTIEIVASQTDASLGVSVEQDNESAKLFITNPPQLNAKRVVLKISDNYGYTQYLRYVVAATTQVVISSSDIVFETGGEIKWDKNNQFPISFKKENEETIQLSSFYEAIIPGAKESTEEVENVQITTSNISDNYGDASSLRATTGNDGKLYGVQLDSVITYTYKDSDGKDAKKLYIPFAGEPISYDVYKLAEQDGTVLKSFDKYKKQIVKYDGANKTWDSTNPNGVAVIGDAGVFNPQIKPAATEGTPAEYYLDYVIELYRENNSSTPAAIIAFTILQVSASKNLYYASRQNPADCYTFEYDISIDGTDIVNDDNKISNIGNAQYGSATSINTTLNIKVYKGDNPIDTISVGILLRFGIYPQVKQQVSGLTSYDYIGIDDNLNKIIKTKDISLIPRNKEVDLSEANEAKKYYTILGNATSNLDTNKTADVMQSGKFDKEYEYDSSTRVLSLKATLDNENKAVINNIQYTYDGTNKTLTIGYRKVALTDNKFDDEVTGISYQVKENTLYVSKKVDNAGKVTINNIQYTVASDETVSYETLYESIFVVWEYDHDNNSETSPLIYWAQWNYKVVDKFNQVTTGDPLEAQDGNIKVKLDWVKYANAEKTDWSYRFNANTLELWKKDDTDPLGTAKWISDADGNRYDIVIGGTTYKIVVENGNMKFKNGESYYQVGSTELALELEEEIKQNSSWADKIKLTGLDGGEISLNDAANIIVKVGGKNLEKVNGKYTIDGKGPNLAGESLNLQIFYKSKIKEEGLTLTDGYYEKLLKFNGNEIKVTFEHFTVPTNS